MKLTIKELREIIRETISGSFPEESYKDELLDDHSFKGKSVFVRDDAKKKIKSWAKDMKLSTK